MPVIDIVIRRVIKPGYQLFTVYFACRCFTIYLYISLGFLIIIGLYTTLGYSVHFVYYCTVRQEIYQLLRGVAVVHYGDR